MVLTRGSCGLNECDTRLKVWIPEKIKGIKVSDKYFFYILMKKYYDYRSYSTLFTISMWTDDQFCSFNVNRSVQRLSVIENG